MALFRGLFVRKDAARGTTPVEARKALAALLAPAGPAAARPGLLSGGNVTGTNGWAYSVPALAAVLSRGASDGAVVAGNDGALTVGTDPAPASGSRIDIVWLRHADVDAGDSTSDILVGVAKGGASGTPQPPAIPAGALELARATVGSGATNTQHANVTIAQTAARTATRGAPVPVPNASVRDAYRDALTAAGQPASPLHPVTVIRADAAPGQEIEVCTDGTNWRAVPTSLPTWRTYTPQVKVGAATVALGNGYLAAAYQEMGSTVHVRVQFQLGSTTAFNGGSGAIAFEPPVLPRLLPLPHPVGSCRYSGGAAGHGAALVHQTSGWLLGATAAGVDITHSTVFSVNHYLLLSATYERA